MLLHLNQVLGSQTEEMFITAFYGIYNARDRSIIYSNAGHHPPAVILKNSITMLQKSRSVPLAIMKNIELVEEGKVYTNSRAFLPAKSKLLLYTDGLVEAKNAFQREIDFSENFNERLILLNRLDCKNFTDKLYSDLVKFHGSESFSDDICVICMDIL